jgi:hypothetical protein
MIVRLCDALDIPLRERNDLLNRAGYAALYPERPLEGSEMRSGREALRRIIEHHEPYPAFVVDRKWRIVMNNEGASRIVAACLGEDILQALSTDGCLNFMRMMFEPTRMRPRILNWTFVASRLLARLRREAAGDALSPSSALLRELAPTATCGQISTEDLETCANSAARDFHRRLNAHPFQHNHDLRNAAGRRASRTSNRDGVSSKSKTDLSLRALRAPHRSSGD